MRSRFLLAGICLAAVWMSSAATAAIPWSFRNATAKSRTAHEAQRRPPAVRSPSRTPSAVADEARFGVWSNALTRTHTRAEAWRHCIMELDARKRLSSSLRNFPKEIIYCELPYSTGPLGFASVHVYKSGGTTMNVMVHALCACHKGKRSVLKSSDKLPRNSARPVLLISTERDPRERFLSIVFEAARRGSLASFVPLANATHSALAVVAAIATGHTQAQLRGLNMHFNHAIGFLAEKKGSLVRQLPHLNMIARLDQPDELHAIWDALAPSPSCQKPRVEHARDRTDPDNYECFDKSCHLDRLVPTDLLQYFSLSMENATEALLATIVSLYDLDMICYNASTQAVAALGPLLADDPNNRSVPFMFG